VRNRSTWQNTLESWSRFVDQDETLVGQQYRVQKEPDEVVWSYFGHDPDDPRYMVIWNQKWGCRSVKWWFLVPVDGDQEDLTRPLEVNVRHDQNPAMAWTYRS
jgi:hypothetical protein